MALESIFTTYTVPPLSSLGQDDQPAFVSQGTGLGVRQHDDVMLSWGYSRKITKRFTLPPDDFAVISLRVPAGVNHHAEARSVQSYNAPINFKVIVGLAVNELPAVVNQIPAFNQKYAEYDPAVQSIFEWRGVHVTNPITGTIDDTTIIDEIDLYSQTAQGLRASSADAFSSLSGRYYTGVDTERVIVVLFENTNGGTAEVEYIYSWHEF